MDWSDVMGASTVPLQEDPDVIDGDDGEADPTGSGPTGSGSTGSGPIGSGPIGEQLLMQHYLGVMASFDGFHGNVVQKVINLISINLDAY